VHFPPDDLDAVMQVRAFTDVFAGIERRRYLGRGFPRSFGRMSNAVGMVPYQLVMGCCGGDRFHVCLLSFLGSIGGLSMSRMSEGPFKWNTGR
jgi:hypothetical protein